MQWPINERDTPILHISKFETEDGLGKFSFHQWKVRGMVKDILSNGLNSSEKKFYYLTTGRTLAQYNNSAQTSSTTKLNKRYNEDVVLASSKDKEFLGDKILLKSIYGESGVLKVKFIENMKPNTLFSTFHFPESKINYLFGDESDELVKTASFKSIKVEVIKVNKAQSNEYE